MIKYLVIRIRDDEVVERFFLVGIERLLYDKLASVGNHSPICERLLGLRHLGDLEVEVLPVVGIGGLSSTPGLEANLPLLLDSPEVIQVALVPLLAHRIYLTLVDLGLR